MKELEGLSDSERELILLRGQEEQQRVNLLRTLYPEDGKLSRHNYPKHMKFFAADYRERCMIAANRVGKSFGVGGFECTLHATGLYPDWWTGRRFDKPVSIWAAGDTSKTVRDIIQEALIGPYGQEGSGLIPGDLITRTTPKHGMANAVEDIYVRHVSGGISHIGLKSYDQRRESFQGTAKDIIWLDEEPPLDIYAECLIRTLTTGGDILCTFTPLNGISEVVLSFIPGGKFENASDAAPGKFVVSATWDDAPHLSDKEREKLLESIPPYQRDARSRGIPQLGSGAIYPLSESDIVCDIFDIPHSWPRCYGMDVGWNRTAVIWAARDPSTDTVYLYDEYYRGQAEPSIHADAIKTRGAWIPGVVDPAARGRSQVDGLRLLNLYVEMDLDLMKADNSVDAGILAVWQRLSAGRLKVFRHLGNWLGEFRIYRRDEKGNIVKQADHLLDATRYMIMSGIDRATTRPDEREEVWEDVPRNATTGY